MLALATATFLFAGQSVAAVASGGAANDAKRSPTTKPPLELSATVLPTGGVTLKNARGSTVTHLVPGWYTILIDVETKSSDFHLIGPGISKWTRRRFFGDVLWGVHLVKGDYLYRSDSDVRATTRRVAVS